MTSDSGNTWQLFKGDNSVGDSDIAGQLPPPPNWRPFGKDISPGETRRKRRGETFQSRPDEIKMVNAALCLRRPLLITGKPGTGKSSLAYAVASELNLGEVLYWPITTRSTLASGLYTYDAIGRLQEVKQMEVRKQAAKLVDDPQKIADFITLGPLGTALLPSPRPRILLIDEIDKSDIDLPNDLLTIFEEGRFEIPELLRLEADDPKQSQKEAKTVSVRTAYSDSTVITQSDLKVAISGGRVSCNEFPLVILTSNGERDFPAPFLRRCLRLNMAEPNRKQLEDIIAAHFRGSDLSAQETSKWIDAFLKKRDKERQQLSTDQLLNALYLVLKGREEIGEDFDDFVDRFLLPPLDRPLAAAQKKAPGTKPS